MVIRAALLLIAVACALPQDAIVPEAELDEAGSQAYGEAKAKVEALLQQGSNLDQCKQLGQTTIDEITGNVEATQTILNGLDNGDGCEDLGEDDVEKAKQNKATQDQECEDAKSELTAATGALVTLAPMPYATLAGETCSWIHADPKYQEAHARYETAVTAEAKECAEAKAAQDTLDAAIATAAQLAHECKCRVQKEHATENAAATKAHEADEQAWTQAHNMICVADSTTYENCEIPTCPAVTEPYINPDAADEVCVSEPGPNLIVNGGFEEGWSSPWTVVNQGESGLPGWSVDGNIDFGDYNRGGHCSGFTCAYEGQAFVDMCGRSTGRINQQVSTVAGGTYQLKLAYDAHAGCTSSGTVMQMDVLVDGARVTTLEHVNEATWHLNWAHYEYTFTATLSTTKISLLAGDNRCGCMLVDAVELREI